MQPCTLQSRPPRFVYALLLLAILFGGAQMPQAQAAVAAPSVPLEGRFQGHDRYAADGFLTDPAPGDPLDIALAYLRGHTAELKMTADDLADIVVKDRYVDKNNGVTHLYLRQRLRGIEVYNGDININITRDGRIVNLGDGFVHDLRNAANTATATLTAAQAIRRTADSLGLTVTDSIAPIAGGDAADGSLMQSGGISRAPIPVKLMYQPIDSGRARLVWDLQIQPTASTDWLSLRTDAVTGALLSQVNWTINEGPGAEFVSDAQAAPVARTVAPTAAQPRSASLAPLPPNSYEVYAFPTRDPDDGPRTIVTNPADALASPFGWHDTNGVAGAEFTTTQGNNTHTYADLSAPDGFSAGDVEVDGGSGLAFSAPIDLTAAPSSYRDAAITNLFYWTNTIHDIFYHYGFDEASGNFQQNNYGHGGNGSDAVNAESQDYIGLNNANFSSPPDGQPGRMQMYIWAGVGTAGITIQPGNSQLTVGVAAFGPTSFDTTSDVILVNDNVASVTDGCDTIINNIAGKIALIDRGTCSFKLKATNAQAAGAIGAIIVNNVSGTTPPGLADGVPAGAISIPVLSVTQSDGNALKASLLSGTVSAHMTRVAATDKDSGLDSGIVVHEYGHGISTRLTGGPSNSGCLSAAEEAGEGWSDFFALALTAKPTDTRTTPRPIGTYVSSQPANGAGIRRYPYTTDMTVNPETYDTLKLSSETHNVGEVWATMVWEMYWNMVDDHGFNAQISTGNGGNNRAIQLVIDGLKFQPCNPTFVQARDAILSANLVDYGGADQCRIWEAFAKRGLGYSADAGLNSSTADGTEAFDLPPACGVNPRPPIVDVCAPAPAIYQLDIGPSLGASVTLSTAGEPASATVAFSTNPTAAGSSSTMTIGNIAALAPGGYPFQVIGSSTRTFTTNVTLNVSNAAPSIATLASPANGASNQPTLPTLSWIASTQGVSYTLQVATDAAFAHTVYTTTTRATSQVLPQSLKSSTTYYWRVIAANACGTSSAASASFTVRAVPRILLVNDVAIDAPVRTYFTDALDGLSVAYDVWDTATSDEPDSGALANYATVIWATSQNGYPTQASETALADFLDHGHCLFISSQEYFFNRGLTPFMQNYLGVASGADDTLETTVTGVGPTFSGIGPATLALPYDNHTDRVSPNATATLAFSGNNGGAVDSGVQKDGGSYRTTYWGFGFEGLPSATERQNAMQRVLTWCTFQADLSLQQTVSSQVALRPGQPITYTLSYKNNGAAIASGVLLTDTLPVALTSLSVTSSGPAITPIAGAPYRWQIGDLAPGASGAITITGVVDPSLTANVSGSNIATITTSAFDSNPTNNSAQATFSVVVPQLAFSSAAYSVAESGGSALISVTLDAPNPFAATSVTYASSDGSAQAGSDYSASSGTLIIPAGQVRASFSVPIADDAAPESGETVLLSLSNASGAALVAPSTATLTILANDGTIAPQITSPLPLDARLGVAYSHQFTASGQPQPSFTLTAGILPPGLTLSADGLLAGVPTQAGSYTGIRVTASNGMAPDATQTFSIVVSATGSSVYLPLVVR